ncbi:hypothetical protein D3C76_1719140 [compost metagenome]
MAGCSLYDERDSAGDNPDNVIQRSDWRRNGGTAPSMPPGHHVSRGFEAGKRRSVTDNFNKVQGRDPGHVPAIFG